jgi:hypothetical protein
MGWIDLYELRFLRLWVLRWLSSLLVTPCGLLWGVYHRFRGLYCFHHQGDGPVCAALQPRRQPSGFVWKTLCEHANETLGSINIRISLISERLSVSQEGLCTVELSTCHCGRYHDSLAVFTRDSGVINVKFPRTGFILFGSMFQLYL